MTVVKGCKVGTETLAKKELKPVDKDYRSARPFFYNSINIPGVADYPH